MQQTVARNLPDFDTLMRSLISGSGLVAVGGTLLGLSSGLVNFLLFAFAALSLAYYWLIEVAHFERLWLSGFLPINARVPARNIWRGARDGGGRVYSLDGDRHGGDRPDAASALSRATVAVRHAAGAGRRLQPADPRLGPVVAVLAAFAVALAALPFWQALLLLGIGLSIQYATHVFAERAMKADALKVNALLQVLLLLALAELGGL